MNVNVFPLQCLQSPHRPGPNLFWENVSGLAKTPLLILESFTDSATTLEAAAYAAASSSTGDPGIYRDYMAKYASTPCSAFDGESLGSACNVAENRTKLEAWTETKTTDVKSE